MHEELFDYRMMNHGLEGIVLTLLGEKTTTVVNWQVLDSLWGHESWRARAVTCEACHPVPVGFRSPDKASVLVEAV